MSAHLPPFPCQLFPPMPSYLYASPAPNLHLTILPASLDAHLPLSLFCTAYLPLLSSPLPLLMYSYILHVCPLSWLLATFLLL